MRNYKKFILGFVAALSIGSSANAALLINWVTGDYAEVPFEKCYRLADFFDGLSCYGGLNGSGATDNSGFSILSESQRKAVIDGKVERKIAPKVIENKKSRKEFEGDVLKFLNSGDANFVKSKKRKCIKAGGTYMTNSHGSMCLMALISKDIVETDANLAETDANHNTTRNSKGM